MKSLQDPACGGLRTASAATDSLRVRRRARRSSRAPRAVVAKASTPAAATPAKQALGAPSKSSPAAATTAPPSGSKPTPANLLSSLPAVLPLPAPLPAVRTTHALGAGVLALFAALLISRLGRARGCVTSYARAVCAASIKAVAQSIDNSLSVSRPIASDPPFCLSSVDGLVDRGVGLSDDRNVDSDRFYKGERALGPVYRLICRQ